MSKKIYTNEKEIYWNMEAPFLYDYVNFANHLRVMQVIESKHEEFTMKQDGKRWCLILLLEAYQKSLEDLSAMLLAFKRRFNKDEKCSYQKNNNVEETPITYTLINYQEATIKNVLDSFSSEETLVAGLKINSIESLNMKHINPSINYKKYYTNIYKDLNAWSNDQEKRLRVYNKIKHGPIVVGSAKIFNRQNKSAPAVVYCDYKANLSDHPLIAHIIKFTEEEFILLQSGILKISNFIRYLISIYMCNNHKDFLREQGFIPTTNFFIERRPGVKNR